MGGRHQEPLAAHALPPGARSSLARYLDLVEAWASRVNLTGATTPERRVAVLVAPVLPATTLVRSGHLLDVGSGNGSPGLVLALLRPELQVTLVEPRLKRWAFLREAVRALEREDVRVWRGRLEDYDGAPADTVTLRALQLPLRALALAAAPDARALVFGRRPKPEAGWQVKEGPAGIWLADRECST